MEQCGNIPANNTGAVAWVLLLQWSITQPGIFLAVQHSSAASLAYATSVFTTIKDYTHDMQSSGNKVTGVSGIRCMCCGDGVETYRERALIKQFNRIII